MIGTEIFQFGPLGAEKFAFKNFTLLFCIAVDFLACCLFRCYVVREVISGFTFTYFTVI